VVKTTLMAAGLLPADADKREGNGRLLPLNLFTTRRCAG